MHPNDHDRVMGSADGDIVPPTISPDMIEAVIVYLLCGDPVSIILLIMPHTKRRRSFRPSALHVIYSDPSDLALACLSE